MHNNSRSSKHTTNLQTRQDTNAMKNIIKFSLGLITAVAVSAFSARADAPVRNSPPFPVLDFLVDANGAPVTATSDPGTKLYNARFCDAHPPILAPDGHQLTLGEWVTASGRASVKCNNKGTHVVIQVSGLIPNGTYTIWHARLDSTGTPIGVGSLGPNDGSQNHFVANANGAGELSTTVPVGPLSMFGDAEACLFDETNFIFFGVYHLDGQTHGPVPGPVPGCTFCEQFGFLF